MTDAGRVTTEQAKSHAESEFEKYHIIQDKLFQSDFDKYGTSDFLDFKDEDI